MRLGDGRWRISGSEKHTFTEPNEDLAVEYFKNRTRETYGKASNLGTVLAHSSAHDALVDMTNRTLAAGGYLDATTTELPSGGYAISDETLSPKHWAWLKKQIIKRPKWVAEQCGIEQIGYLSDLKKPEPIPTLESLNEIWKTHFKSSDEQKRKCAAAFKNFRKITKIASLTEITAERVVEYRDAVYARNLSGKTQSNLYTRIRRYISFFKERAVAIDEMNRVGRNLELLIPNTTTITVNPQPITRVEWEKLLSASSGDDRAMVLLMLNCALYLQEVIKLEWNDIRNGCLITHRAKTGKCVRVAVLWQQTLKSLEAVSHKGPFVFYNYAGMPLGIKGAEKRFRQLRDAANIQVTSSQLRDGAYTAAVEANVTSNLCQLLVGHRSGLADHYVKRRPTMVAPACEAIRLAYGIGNSATDAEN